MPSSTKEPLIEQIASFVGFFILLLVFKTFFVPLFVIPTGSMAETLCGAHATHTCPNCGYEYQIGFLEPPYQTAVFRCPNCRWREAYMNPPSVTRTALGGVQQRPPTRTELSERVRPTFGDRIAVLGWPYDFGAQRFKPKHWDVVVFRNPNDPEQNFIKRLIGLPGERVQIIDGDVFINDEVQRKTPKAQETLWFTCYNHNYQPKHPGGLNGDYLPRWTPQTENGGWVNADSRAPHFDGLQRPRTELLFVTDTRDSRTPGAVEDVYGYNAPVYAAMNNEGQWGTREINDYETVTDTRLSCVVDFQGGDGYVELSSTKYNDRFSARIEAGGRLVLSHEDQPTGAVTEWGSVDNLDLSHPIRVALANADYVVSVSVNGETVLQSTDDQYSVTVREAARRASLRQRPRLSIAAERVQATLRDLLVQRDINYRPGDRASAFPLTLGPDDYFVMGDNSPNSHDGRLWRAEHLAAHLKTREGYQVGTVPADQMIGRAFFVYWPGFLSNPVNRRSLVPDFGRVRWIH